MKLIDVKSNTYIDFGVENNDKDLKFKVGYHITISKYKNISANGYTPDWSEEASVRNKIKNTILLTYVTEDLHREKLLERFMSKNCKKINQSSEWKNGNKSYAK